LVDKVDFASIVEYGYYADSNALDQMATMLGGSKIFMRDFDDYDLKSPSLLGKVAEPKVEWDFKDYKKSLKSQNVSYYDESTASVITLSLANKNSLLIPQSVKEVYLLTNYDFSKEYLASINHILVLAYSELSKNRIESAEKLLGTIYGEHPSFYEDLQVAFGKQRLEELKLKILESIKPNNPKVIEASKPKSVGKNTYSIMNLIEDLTSETDNKVLSYHERWSYNRIGAKRSTRKVLTSSDIKKLSQSKNVKEAEKVLKEVKVATFTPNNPKSGSSVSNITWNSERANISMLLRIDGKVSLPKNNVRLKEVDSFIFRNYSIVKDGIVNFNELPVKLTETTATKLKKKLGDKIEKLSDGNYVIYLMEIPVVNKSQIEKVNFEELAILSTDLLKNKFAQKYLNYLGKSINISSDEDSREYESFVEKYSESQIEYLKSVGVTPRNGFSPLTDKVDSEDFYFAPSIKVKIKSFSSIPSIESVVKKVSEKKSLTPSEKLLNNYINHYYDLYMKYGENEVKKEIVKVKSLVSKLNLSTSRMKFSALLSRKELPESTFSIDDFQVAVESVQVKESI
jgi:hypothetical protein